MEDTAYRAIAIVGVGAVLPEAPNVPAFWENVKTGRYSISEVTPDRWDAAAYYDPDHRAPDKTYSKIGGWVREHVWDPMKWRLAIPPRVVDSMDGGQKWAVSCTREALEDYGYPKRALDLDRTAVILGNSMAGEKHYLTSLRIHFPEYAHELTESASFAALPAAVRRDIINEFHARIGNRLPEITEDTMPGELSSCLAGRIANVFNFHGPNFVVDAACASAMAAITSATEGLIEKDFDVAIAGGIDRNMGAPTFIKFCKIGALSATGIRPFAEGADGFVMGEGAVILMLKRLADAEHDGDNIYAVLRGIGGASDGKGKGITAPNPVGQKLSIERAWRNAGLSPASATFIEGHGTSTPVGDVVEAQCLAEVLSEYKLPRGSVALGSVKSNIGHLKSAAGAAGLLKTALALRDKVIPPSLHCEHPNPNIDFAHSPLYVNTELKPWSATVDGVRRAGVSAFGFGGTNFHAVLEEHIPHRLTGNGKRSIAVADVPPVATGHVKESMSSPIQRAAATQKLPLRGALVIGAETDAELVERLRAVLKAAEAGHAPRPAAPAQSDLHAKVRVAIDYADAAELVDKSGKALKALVANQPAIWKALRAQGIFFGHGAASKVAFLYTGQGSQYVNMLQSLRAVEPIVADTFAGADRALTPLLGKPLSEFIFVDGANASAVNKAEEDLRQTSITQPAVLATDIALTRLLAAYGIEPDLTMGHSLGEYGALVASGALPFEDALEAVCARGREMTRVSMADNGKMAAVFAPLPEIERILKTIDGYVVIANINSNSQAVIGGASTAVTQAIEVFQKAGYNVVPLPVSHAFHTSIVAPASEPLRRTLERLRLRPPRLPIVANVSGEFYPMQPEAAPEMLNILGQQIASPVQFVKGLGTLYAAGARIFVEVGPKKALQGFVDDVFVAQNDVVSLFTNHPKVGDIVAFNQALCGLYAAGLGLTKAEVPQLETTPVLPALGKVRENSVPRAPAGGDSNGDRFAKLGHLFADVLEQGWQIYEGDKPAPASAPVVITGAALGLPGTEHVFDDANIGRMLRGDQFIGAIPARLRRAMLDKHITRLVKSDNGGGFESIDDVSDVIKLAARAGTLDLEKEFGVPPDRLAALDSVTRLAIGVGLDALRDAGIPLVMRYKTTSKGTQLPDRWCLPDTLRDDTGVIFASAFPGYDSFADEMSRYYTDHARREQLAMLESVRVGMAEGNGHSGAVRQIDQRIEELRTVIAKEPYTFDRRFLFRALSMGHSQFAEFIGARGPNTQINAACASTTQAMALAEDWIRAGRCRRVIVISADDVTSDHLLEWVGAGFLASGAAATDEVVADAALPFDRRRHGMIIGMGAAALVVESADAAHERGLRPICEVLSTVTANSAFHGTRLDVQHITQMMERLVSDAEVRCGIDRQQIASRMVFVSHETYTPARGGSASAEIHALRHVFGDATDRIVIANTKGFTGHAMGAGIEDVVAVKALETGTIPPVANFKEVDPELGPLNLSNGGSYPVEYALRLGAGFGSQISMTLVRWVKTKDGVRPRPDALGYAYRIDDPNTWKAWLSRVSGRPAESLEVVRRTLRVADHAMPAEIAAEAQALRSVPPPPTEAAEKKPSVLPEASIANGSAKERILAIAAEKTGYPVEMLALDLDLEADLGIDTVKQAELFASVRAAFNIPRDENLKLRDFPTLGHVIQFALDRSPAALGVPKQPAAAQAPVVAQTITNIPVEQKVLEIVAEKTGYPKEMLDLDLDLEADLGIDTVKQAEMFASVRAAFNIPRDENVKLRDFPTLAHVIQFARDRSPAVPGAPEAPVVVQVPVTVEASPTDIQQKVLEIVADKTGYPKEMLDLDLDLEADLGIDTVKQAEMFASVRAAFNIPRDENLKLRDFPTLAHVIQFARDRSAPTLAAAPPVAATPAAAPPAPAPSEVTPRKTTVSTSIMPAPTDDSIQQKVLEIVAEKTGYPAEMLDLDLDLEADLGIDTVKQAEMFASVRAAFNIPRDENLKLRDFPTLCHVIQFARDRKPETAVAPAPAPAGPLVKSAPPKLASLEAANRIPRRVPVPNLRPALTICKSTGVVLGKGSRVVVMPDKGGVAEALAGRLERMGVEVLRIEDTPVADALASRLGQWLAAGPIQGVYWLPALDNEGCLTDMDTASWHEALRVRMKLLYTTMRTLYEQIAASNTFLVSATRLGGQHGYDESGALAPLGGAVVGFTKTYKRERIDALVKAVDFESDRNPSEASEILIDETLRDPGAVEIGHKGGLRWSVGLEERPADDGQPGLTLNKDTVFLVTGAAGSIVSAIVGDLAAASGGTFYLLDLAAPPDPKSPDLARFVSDKEGLKRDLFARIQSRGERPTPALVEKELAAMERAQAARAAIDAVQAAGGTAHYFAVDLTDASAVAQVINHVREASGRIDVLLHAAGTERSHLLSGKDQREFDLVFDVKADGWFNLQRAIGDLPLGTVVAFSSVAARFGNAGQIDYSAANDLLCKIVSGFRGTRPATRGIAVDWTAWGGLGMATRGSIPKMMELAGIDMLPPEAGIPLIRRELTAGGTRGEIVIGQRLGILLNEWDATGGLDRQRLPKPGPMIGDVTGASLYDGVTIETTLDPEAQPFLHDHKIDGTPVMPGVMGIEAFAEAAALMLPGWHVEAVEDVDFQAPLKFYRNEARTVTIQAVFHQEGDAVVADCRLIGRRSVPNQTEPQLTTHFTARVWLTNRAPEPSVTRRPGPISGAVVESRDIYRIYFHGPAYQVLEQAWRDGDRMIGKLAGGLPGNHYPPEQPTLIAPRLIELCFQTVGLWEITTQDRYGLPLHVQRVSFDGAADFAEQELYAVVTPDSDGGTFDAEVVDEKGNRYLSLSGYRTVPLSWGVSSESLTALQTVMA